MKYFKLLSAVALVFVLCSASSLKKDRFKSVYAFGLSASFTDTVVYYTDIQLLDSAEISKQGFLVHRDEYSYQLKTYLEQSGLQQNSTCMIYFSDNEKKLEKEAEKLLNKYRKNKKVSVERIETGSFRFAIPER